MKLYEYEGKKILSAYGNIVPDGVEIDSAHPDVSAYSFGYPAVIKAQILSGKRGVQGGILFADSPQEALVHIQHMFTHGIAGHEVAAARIECKIPLLQEYYMSLMYDPSACSLALLLSGGEEAWKKKSVRSQMQVL